MMVAIMVSIHLCHPDLSPSLFGLTDFGAFFSKVDGVVPEIWTVDLRKVLHKGADRQQAHFPHHPAPGVAPPSLSLCGLTTRVALQGYLAHKKLPPPRTLL